MAWVLWHMYGDGSGAHIERAYWEEKRAKEDFVLLTEGDSKSTATEWKLSEVPILGTIPLRN